MELTFQHKQGRSCLRCIHTYQLIPCNFAVFFKRIQTFSILHKPTETLPPQKNQDWSTGSSSHKLVSLAHLAWNIFIKVCITFYSHLNSSFIGILSKPTVNLSPTRRFCRHSIYLVTKISLTSFSSHSFCPKDQ